MMAAEAEEMPRSPRGLGIAGDRVAAGAAGAARVPRVLVLTPVGGESRGALLPTVLLLTMTKRSHQIHHH